jgi:hypothetical protein
MQSNPAAEMARQRAKKLGPERCSEIASTAAQARWKGHTKSPKKPKRELVAALASEHS